MWRGEIGFLERRNYGGVDTLANTTTAAQRRERRRQLEAKYGLRSARAMAENIPYRSSSKTSGLNNSFPTSSIRFLLFRNSSINVQ